jgi:hypothetical protein
MRLRARVVGPPIECVIFFNLTRGFEGAFGMMARLTEDEV